MLYYSFTSRKIHVWAVVTRMDNLHKSIFATQQWTVSYGMKERPCIHLKKKQLSVIFNSFQHWTITLYFHMNFISKLRVFLTNKRLQNRHRVPRCRMPVLQNFLLMKVVARMDRDSSLHLLSIAVHCWVQTLSIFGYSVQFCVRSGRFGKKILNTLYFFLFSFLFVCAYLWMIYLRPPICF